MGAIPAEGALAPNVATSGLTVRGRGRSQSSAPNSEWDAFRINIGSSTEDAPESLSEWIAELAGLDQTDLGRVKSSAESAVVEVRDTYMQDVIDALHGQTVDGHQLRVTKA